MSNLYPDLYDIDFPDSIDKFAEYLDINASDGLNIKKFQEAMEKGDEKSAIDILNKIPNYKNKILSATDLNKISNAIIALEKFYKTDVKPYSEEKQIEWQEKVDQFSYKQDYNPNKIYYKNNYVSYADEKGYNYIYIALANPPKGALPTDTRYWRKLTVQGVTGPASSGVSFMGAWDANTTYQLDQAVEYDNTLWGCLAENLNEIPPKFPSSWKVIYKIPVSAYPVSYDKPQTPREGSLWFRIVE